MRCLLYLLLVPGFAYGQMTLDEKKAAAEFVISLHDAKSGGYRVDATAEPSLRATSGAVRSLGFLKATKLGVTLPDRLLTSKYVTSHYDSLTGSFKENRSNADVTITSIGLIAAAELEIPISLQQSEKYLRTNAKTFEDVRIAAAAMEIHKLKPKWLDEWITIADSQLNNDGTSGKGTGQARETASVAAMKLRLGYPVANRKRVIEAIVNGQKTDGGWGKADGTNSDLETSYRVMRALHLLKEKPKDSMALTTFLANCRNKDGGYSVVAGGPSTMSGVYYASAINSWLEK